MCTCMTQSGCALMFNCPTKPALNLRTATKAEGGWTSISFALRCCYIQMYVVCNQPPDPCVHDAICNHNQAVQHDDCRCHVTSQGFAHMTAKLRPIAPLVLLLEGGYNDAAIASASEACLRVLLGQQLPQLPPKGIDLTPTGAQTIKKFMEVQVRPLQLT